jgi:Amt family ammonium transporter
MIGSFAGIIVVYSVEFFDKLKIDDPVGAISVHGICGAFGTLAVGLFATEGGLFSGGGFELLGIQAIGVLATFMFVFASAFIIFKFIDKTYGLRVSEHEEVVGLDIEEHGAFAYPDFELPL